MSDENKKRTAVWLSPSVIRRMDSWLEEDNCSTRSEFIEKALRFYMGYLATEDTSEYLSQALVDTLQGIVADNSNRLRTMIFKWCVELNMMGHTRAARLCGGRGEAHQWADQLRPCAGPAAAASG